MTRAAALRSALYVPGDRPDMLAKAPSRGADALIVDLEDAVPPAGKDRARSTVAAWLAGRKTDPAGPALWVRVNSGERGHDDVRALLGRGVTGFFVAKAESAEDVDAVARLLADDPSAALCPVLESAAAVLAAPRIAGCPRVTRLQLGRPICGRTSGSHSARESPNCSGPGLMWSSRRRRRASLHPWHRPAQTYTTWRH